MASVFWDSEVIQVNFLPHGVTINAQYYNNSLCNDVNQVTWKKRFGKRQTSSYCMTTFNCQILGDIGSSKLGNHEPPFLQP
jgi:hypothetical protein